MFVVPPESIEELMFDLTNRRVTLRQEGTTGKSELDRLNTTVIGRRSAGNEATGLETIDQLVHRLSRDIGPTCQLRVGKPGPGDEHAQEGVLGNRDLKRLEGVDESRPDQTIQSRHQITGPRLWVRRVHLGKLEATGRGTAKRPRPDAHSFS